MCLGYVYFISRATNRVSSVASLCLARDVTSDVNLRTSTVAKRNFLRIITSFLIGLRVVNRPQRLSAKSGATNFSLFLSFFFSLMYIYFFISKLSTMKNSFEVRNLAILEQFSDTTVQCHFLLKSFYSTLNCVSSCSFFVF